MPSNTALMLRAYLALRPEATLPEVANETGVPVRTIQRWMTELRENPLPPRHPGGAEAPPPPGENGAQASWRPGANSGAPASTDGAWAPSEEAGGGRGGSVSRDVSGGNSTPPPSSKTTSAAEGPSPVSTARGAATRDPDLLKAWAELAPALAPLGGDEKAARTWVWNLPVGERLESVQAFVRAHADRDDPARAMRVAIAQGYADQTVAEAPEKPAERPARPWKEIAQDSVAWFRENAPAQPSHAIIASTCGVIERARGGKRLGQKERDIVERFVRSLL